MSKKIAIDCDEVLIESVQNLIYYVHQKYNYSWNYDNIRSYMLSDNGEFGLTKEQALVLFDEYFSSDIAKNAAPVIGAVEKVSQWKNMGYELIVVTARNEKATPLTHYQIEKYFPNIFSDIYFAAHYTEKHQNKSTICQTIGAKLLVDDNIDYALDVAEHNIPTILLERPRNNWRADTHPLMTKRKDWYAVEEDFLGKLFDR